MNEVLYLDNEYEVKVDKGSKNLLFKVLCLIFLLGVFYGGFVFRGSEKEVLIKVSDTFFKMRTEKDFLSVFLSTLFSGCVFFLILFLNGFSGIGQPVSFFTVFFNGVGFGTAIGHIYLNEGIKGILFSLLLLLPSFIISGFSVILSARESLRLSNKIFLSLLKGGEEIFEKALSKYIKRFLIIFLLIVFSAIISGITSELFKRFVNL